MSKKILVTGAGGFIGSHLVEQLAEQGQQVKAFVHYNSFGSWGWLQKSHVRERIEVVSGDIRDYDSVEAAVADCSQVFHLAALIGIPYSYVSPQAYIKTNIDGTYNVLQASRQAGIGQVLVTSTSETYGTAQYVPIDEAHPAVGQSPYAATKVGADQLSLSFYRSFELPVKIVRPFNTYGPRQSARAVIPTIMTQLLQRKTEIRLGSLRPTRDFTFVEDTVRGFIAVSRCDALMGQAVNISCGEEISIGNLAIEIGKISGKQFRVVTDDDRVRPDESEVERLCGSSVKLRSHTNWAPQETLESGLRKTWNWLQEHHQLFEAGRYNI